MDRPRRELFPAPYGNEIHMNDSGVVLAYIMLALLGIAAVVGLVIGRSVSASYGAGMEVVEGSQALTYNLVYLGLAIAGGIGVAVMGR